MDIALSTTLHTSFDDAVARTRKALAEQGFGVLTEILATSAHCCPATSLCGATLTTPTLSRLRP